MIKASSKQAELIEALANGQVIVGDKKPGIDPVYIHRTLTGKKTSMFLNGIQVDQDKSGLALLALFVNPEAYNVCESTVNDKPWENS